MRFLPNAFIEWFTYFEFGSSMSLCSSSESFLNRIEVLLRSAMQQDGLAGHYEAVSFVGSTSLHLGKDTGLECVTNSGTSSNNGNVKSTEPINKLINWY